MCVCVLIVARLIKTEMKENVRDESEKGRQRPGLVGESWSRAPGKEALDADN